VHVDDKGKVHPTTGHEGPEGEQRYSSTLSLTSALDGGGWSTLHPGRFTPGYERYPIVDDILQDEWAAGKVQNPNELLMVSVRNEFVHYVIQTLRQTVRYLFNAGQWTSVASY
jgi:hypothetical protein